jgi:hypothetical protein
MNNFTYYILPPNDITDDHIKYCTNVWSGKGRFKKKFKESYCEVNTSSYADLRPQNPHMIAWSEYPISKHKRFFFTYKGNYLFTMDVDINDYKIKDGKKFRLRPRVTGNFPIDDELIEHKTCQLPHLLDYKFYKEETNPDYETLTNDEFVLFIKCYQMLGKHMIVQNNIQQKRIIAANEEKNKQKQLSIDRRNMALNNVVNELVVHDITWRS